MEKTFKKSLQVVMMTSTLIFLVVLLLSSPWISNLYEHVFNRQVTTIILIYLALLILITFITFLASLLWECKVKNNIVITNEKGIFRKKTTYSFYDPDKVTVEKGGSLFKRFSNVENLRIYENGKKIVDIEVKKDEEREIYELFSLKRETEKKHYERDKNFVFNGKSFFSLFEKPTLLFIVLVLYDLFMISLFKIWDYRLPIININFTLFSLLLMFITSTIYGVFYFVHNSNTSLKINEDSIVSKKGRIFFIELETPIKETNSYVIKYGLLSRLLDIYYISLRLSGTRMMALPLHKDNISFSFGELINNQFSKNKKYLFSIILITIIGLGISVALFFYSIVCGIIILLITLYLIYIELYSDLSINNNRIIIRKRYLIPNLYSLDIRDIKRVVIKKVPFNYSRITFYTNTIKVNKTISNNNLDEIKNILGYFKNKEVA